MNNLFQTHAVDNAGEVAAFSEWLTNCARLDQEVAVAARKTKLAFSTREDVWVINLKAECAPLSIGVLRTHLIDQAQLKFAARDLYILLIDLSKLLGPLFNMAPTSVLFHLSSAFVADLTGAAVAINQTVTPQNKFRLIEHDAYEVALLEPQYSHDAPAYYNKIAIPFAKLQAETTLHKPGQAEWFVSYDRLWIKVLAFYTGDPTLMWALVEDRDPVEAVGKLIKADTYEDAENLLLWQACGRDMDCFSKRFPGQIDALPENLNEYSEKFNRSLPALSMAVAQMKQAYYETRTVETRYGRRLRPGHPHGEAVAFRVFGTVEDIVGVAAVTFWQNRPASDIMLTQFAGGLDTVRISGVGPKHGQELWLQELKPLSTLADPLGQVALRPNVVQL